MITDSEEELLLFLANADRQFKCVRDMVDEALLGHARAELSRHDNPADAWASLSTQLIGFGIGDPQFVAELLAAALIRLARDPDCLEP